MPMASSPDRPQAQPHASQPRPRAAAPADRGRATLPRLSEEEKEGQRESQEEEISGSSDDEKSPRVSRGAAAAEPTCAEPRASTFRQHERAAPAATDQRATRSDQRRSTATVVVDAFGQAKEQLTAWLIARDARRVCSLVPTAVMLAQAWVALVAFAGIAVVDGHGEALASLARLPLWYPHRTLCTHIVHNVCEY